MFRSGDRSASPVNTVQRHAGRTCAVPATTMRAFRGLVSGEQGVDELLGVGDLVAPVDREPEGAGVDGLLGGGALAVAGHVAGRHGHEVRRHAEIVERGHDATRAEEVHLDGGVERRVEGHGGRRVDHHGAGRQRGSPVLVEREAVGRDVAGDRGDPRRDEVREALLAEVCSEAVERVVREDLPPGALLDGRALPGPDQQDELAARDAPQQPLDEGRPADIAGN